MDDRDLQALREFRADEAKFPTELQGRIEERLWNAILDEERRKAGAPSRRRWGGALRPVLAIGAAVVLVAGVAVVTDSGVGQSSQPSSNSSVTRAGGSPLDATARTLFGSDASASAPVVGRIDLSHDDDTALAQGPKHVIHGPNAGSLNTTSSELAQSLPRNPSELRDMLRSSVAADDTDDPSDTRAFRSAIAWIADPSVPTDLRAAMVRALGGLNGIDDAVTGYDLIGRPGVVLGHLDARSGIRTQTVLAADTGTLRELRSFTTTYLDPACPPGTFTELATYGDDGTWIDPSTIPFVEWPQVVAACNHVLSR